MSPLTHSDKDKFDFKNKEFEKVVKKSKSKSKRKQKVESESSEESEEPAPRKSHKKKQQAVQPGVPHFMPIPPNAGVFAPQFFPYPVASNLMLNSTDFSQTTYPESLLFNPALAAQMNLNPNMANPMSPNLIANSGFNQPHLPVNFGQMGNPQNYASFNPMFMPHPMQRNFQGGDGIQP